MQPACVRQVDSGDGLLSFLLCLHDFLLLLVVAVFINVPANLIDTSVIPRSKVEVQQEVAVTETQTVENLEAGAVEQQDVETTVNAYVFQNPTFGGRLPPFSLLHCCNNFSSRQDYRKNLSDLRRRSSFRKCSFTFCASLEWF